MTSSMLLELANDGPMDGATCAPASSGKPCRHRGMVDGQQTLDGFIRPGSIETWTMMLSSSGAASRPRRTLDVEQVCPNLPPGGIFV